MSIAKGSGPNGNSDFETPRTTAIAASTRDHGWRDYTLTSHQNRRPARARAGRRDEPRGAERGYVPLLYSRVKLGHYHDHREAPAVLPACQGDWALLIPSADLSSGRFTNLNEKISATDCVSDGCAPQEHK